MVNYLAILVAAIVAYVIGALWYSPALFGKAWMKLSGMTKKDLAKAKKKGMAKSYIGMFIALLVMTYVLAFIIEALGGVTVGAGAMVGFWVWLGFYATSLLGGVFWESKPWGLYFLNAAHYLVILLVAGGILGVWT